MSNINNKDQPVNELINFIENWRVELKCISQVK